MTILRHKRDRQRHDDVLQLNEDNVVVIASTREIVDSLTEFRKCVNYSN